MNLTQGQKAWVKVYSTFSTMTHADLAKRFLEQFPEMKDMVPTVYETFHNDNLEIFWVTLLEEANQ